MDGILGIDIGGTSVKLAWIDAPRSYVCGQSDLYARPTREELGFAIRRTMNRVGCGRISRVGICVPGLLDRKLRQITASVNVPGLVGVPLDELVSQACGFQGEAMIANDAVATAFDIFQQRQLAGRLLVLALGTGVGAAVLDDGVPLYVEGESPGHLGQIDVSLDASPPTGPDGGAGGLEAYLGAPALKRQYGDELFAAIAQWSANDIPMRALTRTLRIAHAMYRPHHICLAGAIGQRMGHLLSGLREQVARNLTNIARPDWTLSNAADDFHAARGMARLACQPV